MLSLYVIYVMEVLRSMYLTFRIVYSMAASGSNPGSDDFVKVVTPSPVSDMDTRMTVILEQLVKSNEAQVTMQAQYREAQLAMQEQLVRNHEVQLSMQAQIASLVQVQGQLQAQLQNPSIPPAQQPYGVETQMVVQPKEGDPNVPCGQFRKGGQFKNKR